MKDILHLVSFIFEFFRIFFNKWTSNIFEPILIVFTQMDLMKDLILVTRIIITLGGLWVVFANPRLFSSCVSSFIISLFHVQLLHVTSSLGCSTIIVVNIWTTVSGNIKNSHFKSTKLEKSTTSLL